ncbi:MAG: sigma-70 family RNA polymerase sigma factor [Chloroflexi bacterium]|nr:sigma-70 family RNA polymerase sigma factor [Chloroflexota bacterium]
MGTDISVVRRARSGEREAFDQLIDDCGMHLRRIAYGILRDRSLADDAVQRTFLAIWQDLPGLREPERFDAWSYRLLVRACHAEARRSPRWMPSLSLGPQPEPAVDAGIVAVADRDQLERGFRRLSVEHRTVIVLHHFLDLPLVEVAAVMGTSPGTTYSRMHHALRALRAALEADDRPAAQNGMAQEAPH